MPRIESRGPVVPRPPLDSPEESLRGLLRQEEQARSAVSLYRKARAEFDELRQTLAEDRDYSSFRSKLNEWSQRWLEEELPESPQEVREQLAPRLTALAALARAEIENLSDRRHINQARAALLQFAQEVEERVSEGASDSVVALDLAYLEQTLGDAVTQGLILEGDAAATLEKVRAAQAGGNLLQQARLDPDSYLAGRAGEGEETEEGAATLAARQALMARQFGAVTELVGQKRQGRRLPKEQDEAASPSAASGADDLEAKLLRGVQKSQAAAFHQSRLGLSSEEELRALESQATAPDADKLRSRAARSVRVARRRDPAGALSQLVPGVSYELSGRSAKEKGEGLARRILAGLTQQKRLGLPLFSLRSLPNKAAVSIVNWLEAQSPEEIFDFLDGLAEEMDNGLVLQATLRQLRERGLDEEIEILWIAACVGSPLRAARNLLRLRDKEQQVLTRSQQSEAPNQVLLSLEQLRSTQASWSNEGDFDQRWVAEERLFLRLMEKERQSAAGDQTAARIFADVTGARNAVLGEDLAAVLMPARLSVDPFLMALDKARDERCEGAAGFFSASGIEPLPGDVKEQARWVDWLDGYALILPGQGALLGEDENLIRIDAHDLKLRQEEVRQMVPSPSIAIEGQS